MAIESSSTHPHDSTETRAVKMDGSAARQNCNTMRHSDNASNCSHHLTSMIGSLTTRVQVSEGSCAVPSLTQVERVLVGHVVDCKHDIQEC
jgi:hypothetical protein